MNTNKDKLVELEELGKPVVEFLKTHYHPHARVVISMDKISLQEDIIGIPINND